MRPIDSDQLLDFIMFDERIIAPEEHTAEDIVMMIQTAPTISAPPNDPLTPEQLWEMEGEPVWCAFSDGRGGYMIIQWHNSEFFKSFEFGFLLVEEYGKSWLAYRRKQEEGRYEN